MAERTVCIQNVLVVRQSEFGWYCQHEDRPLFIARGQVPPGIQPPAEGTRGVVEVHAFAIADLYPDRPAGVR
jgi:hypothetical protein